MKAFVMRVAAVALAVLVSTSAANAAWMPGFSGSNQFTKNLTGTGPTNDGDGIVNFAVYDNINNDFGSFGLTGTNQFGSGGLTAGRYIYLYQVVNTNPNNSNPDHMLSGLFVEVVPSTIKSGGFVGDTVFQDAEGNVGPVGNVRLGTESGVNDTPLTGFPPTGFGTLSAAVESNSITIQGNLFRFNFFDANRDPAIDVNGFSSVVFLTSDFAPTLGRGRLVDGDIGAGSIPVPTPEPGTIALFGLALPLMGAGYVRRLRAAKAAAQA